MQKTMYRNQNITGKVQSHRLAAVPHTNKLQWCITLPAYALTHMARPNN